MTTIPTILPKTNKVQKPMRQRLIRPDGSLIPLRRDKKGRILVDQETRETKPPALQKAIHHEPEYVAAEVLRYAVTQDPNKVILPNITAKALARYAAKDMTVCPSCKEKVWQGSDCDLCTVCKTFED